MNSLEFVCNKLSLKPDQNLEKCLKLFEEGKGLGELFFEPSVYLDKNLSFWKLDRIESAYQEYKTFCKKRDRYLEDLKNRKEDHSEVEAELLKVQDIKELDEIYRPYKKKKKTKASLAREAGLSDFANQIQERVKSKEAFEKGLEVEAKRYIQPALGFITFETVLKGALDIVVEQFLSKELHSYRADLLAHLKENANLLIKAGEKHSEQSRYKNYLTAKVQPASYYLQSKNYDKFPAIKKAWEDHYLKVSLSFDDKAYLKKIEEVFVSSEEQGDLADFMRQAARKAFEIHMLPSVTTELFDQFYQVSKEVYLVKAKKDYMSLLSTPAYGKKAVLSVFPKGEGEVALCFTSPQGEYISSVALDLKKEDLKQDLQNLLSDILKSLELSCVALPLDKKVRELELLFKETLAALGKDIEVLIVDPRGVLQFIGSEEARFHLASEEKLDNSAMAAFRLAKRLQDPLYEYADHEPSFLVDYPSFLSKEEVSRELKKVLSYLVCSAGLENKDLSLGLVRNLSYFEGEEYKSEGLFDKAKLAEFKKAKLSEKTELSSFLSAKDMARLSKFFKLKASVNLLDQSRVSVEDFDKIKSFFQEKDVASLLKGPLAGLKSKVNDEWKSSLGEDFALYLAEELEAPFKDARRDYKAFSFSKMAKSLEEVETEKLYWGIVTKFSQFGAFVDIGVGGVEGLIHLSELSDQYLSDPRRVLRLGQWVLVKVLKVDLEKKQLSFSKVQAETQRRQGPSGGKGKRSFSKNKESRSGSFKKGSKRPAGKPGARNHKGSQRAPQKPFNNPFAVLQDLNKN